MTTDRLGRKRTPAQEAAIAAHRNPEGIVSRSHNVATDEESHNWFAAQGSRARGVPVARARKRASAPRKAADPTRLSVRGVDPVAKLLAKREADRMGLTLGAFLTLLVLEDRARKDLEDENAASKTEVF